MTSVDGYAPSRARRRVGIGAAVVIALLALAVTVGIGIVRGATAPTEVVTVGSDPVSAEPATVLYVHVAGAVLAPGIYRLHDGARVVDAIAVAGGFTSDADQGAVNLARPVGDGEQLVVPVVGAAPSVGASTAGDGRVNLNTADSTALDSLPRIGPAMAQRILEWRQANGRFTSVEDLLAIPGIGDKMLETLRPLVTV